MFDNFDGGKSKFDRGMNREKWGELCIQASLILALVIIIRWVIYIVCNT